MRVLQLLLLLIILVSLFSWRTLMSLADKTKQVEVLGEQTSQTSMVRCDYFSPCEYITEQGVFWLKVNNPPIKAEQWIQFGLQSEVEHWQVIEAKIEGKSMFMGRIPVTFIAANDHHYVAKTLVGACTTENMIWQLQILLQVNGQEQWLHFDFMVQ